MARAVLCGGAMKRLLLALVALGAALPASALTYHGQIIQTITSTNDPQYKVGQQFLSYYSYNSDTIDGTFSTEVWGSTPVTNTSLTGYVNIPLADHGLAIYPGAPRFSMQQVFAGFAGGYLKVSGGQVTEFNWIFDNGGYYGIFGSLDYGWGAWSLPWWGLPTGENDVLTRGSMTFAPPTVPDTGATLGLLAGGLLLCGWLRRRGATRDSRAVI